MGRRRCSQGGYVVSISSLMYCRRWVQHRSMQLEDAALSARLHEEYFNVGEEGVQKRGGNSHKSGRMFVRAGRSFEEHKEWSAAETKLG